MNRNTVQRLCGSAKEQKMTKRLDKLIDFGARTPWCFPSRQWVWGRPMERQVKQATAFSQERLGRIR
jgi:hypothetical protein